MCKSKGTKDSIEIETQIDQAIVCDQYAWLLSMLGFEGVDIMLLRLIN